MKNINQQEITKEFSFNEYMSKYRTFGVIANKNQGKTMFALKGLIDLKEKNRDIEVYVFGVNEELYEILLKKGIKIIYNKEDILKLKIKRAIIYIDEFADVFSVKSKDKQTEHIQRFINRIYHLEDWLIISTAQTKFWNTFMCSLFECYIVKEVDYDLLVNGTTLKRDIMGLKTTSSYTFDCDIDECCVLSNEITQRYKTKYSVELDTKREIYNPFKIVGEKKGDKNCGENDEINIREIKNVQNHKEEENDTSKSKE